MTNYARNSRWQIHSALPLVTKMAASSAGTMPQLNVTAFNIGQNIINCFCSNTYGIIPGTLGVFDTGPIKTAMTPPPPPAPLQQWSPALRVLSVNPNVSFQVCLPRGIVITEAQVVADPPTPSNPYLFRPVQVGDYTGSTGAAADGFNKTLAADYWVEEFPVNLRVGRKRAAALRKTSSADQKLFYCLEPVREVPMWRGKDMVFGVCVYQKIKGGSGAAKLCIKDDAGVTEVPLATSPAGYLFGFVHRKISDTTTAIETNVTGLGPAGDLIFADEWNIERGTTLTEDDYEVPQNEWLMPVVHVNSWQNVTFSIPNNGGVQSYFYYDVYAETAGAVDITVRAVDVQTEARCATVDKAWTLATSPFAPNRLGGSVMSSSVSGAKVAGAGSMELGLSSIAAFSGDPATWYNTSIDMNMFLLS